LYGNNGTIINPLNVQYVDDGAIGKAINFNGVNEKGSVQVLQNSSLALNQEVTVSYWLRMNSHYGEVNDDNNFENEGNHAVFVKGQEGAISNYIFTSSDTSALWYQRNPNESYSVTNAFNVGDWVHVAFTISKTQVKGYVNGVQVTQEGLSVPVDLTTSNTGSLYIGWLNESWYALDGAVDDFRIYNVALTSDEIQELYQLAD